LRLGHRRTAADRVGTLRRMNNDGYPGTLVAGHPGNLNAVRHGVYSRTGRVLAPRAAEIAEQIMQAPWATPRDVIAAEELGSLIAIAEAIDIELAAGVASCGAGVIRWDS
jgi:hypothetical protein